LLDPLDDLRQLRQKPLAQSLIGNVANAQPDNERTGVGLLRSLGKIFVLGDDGRADEQQWPVR